MLPQPRYEHLKALTGHAGLFEHAEFALPRVELGYTTDDNSRALVLLAADPPPGMRDEIAKYLAFVVDGRTPLGWHNRMSRHGEWMDRRGSDDAHGRALWGLGSVLAAGYLGSDVVAAFMAGLDLDTMHVRSNCYALLGAAAVHQAGVFPDENEGALEQFMTRVSGRLPRPRTGPWPWPEPSMTYDNARLPQALLLAGSAFGDGEMVDEGLTLLEWLIAVERADDGWFSFTPTVGRRRGERGPAFDQQPIEAWAMADACLAASRLDGSSLWLPALVDAAQWFLGRNDVGVDVCDLVTGAGFDGLEPEGVNLNQGAESTLSALGAFKALERAGADTMIQS